MNITVAMKLGIIAKKHWKSILLVLLIIFLVPLMFFSTALTVGASVPAIDENQMRIYIDAATSVGEGKSHIDYKDLISIDAVRYTQDFSKANVNNTRMLAERFLQEHRNVTNYNFTQYINIVDSLNQELQVSIDWRDVVMVDSLISNESFNRSNDELREFVKNFVQINKVSYEEEVVEPVVTRVWKSSIPWLPDSITQKWGWGKWEEHTEYETHIETRYKDDKKVLDNYQVLINLGHNTSEIPEFFKNKDSINQTMQKVIITYTTKSLEEVMNELNFNDEQKQLCRNYRNVGLNVLDGKDAGGNGGSFSGQTETPTGTNAEFIQRVSSGAIETQKKYGVFASISIAQGILESGWGKYAIGNNLFGIKADSSWHGEYVECATKEYDGGGAYSTVARFRAYSSWGESVEDHGKFLKENSRYASAGLFNATDYIGQAYALKSAGYATDPNYPLQLIELIQKYGLYQYDK